MAYDEELALRVRGLLSDRDGISERRMFGGLSFLLHGHMFCGVLGDELVVRVGGEQSATALEQPHARPMDFTGRPLKGYVYVAAEGTAADDALRAWVDRGAEFADSLPPK
ncbi:MAG: TfoX/Sxy family protein [Gaiellaceae bacterium]